MAEDVPAPAMEVAAAVEGKGAEKKKKEKRRGILWMMWNGIFGGKGEDLEKRLRHLSKEEIAAHSRMKRRAQAWRQTARNVVVFSIVAEVVAVIYAILITRKEDFSWQERSLRVFPMFFLPGFCYAIYSALASFTRMRDRKDQKTLKRLRAERQAKIDELKERTNYYTTQQLIQKYDLDPAAKAAAASALANKLGAESGLKVRVGDEPQNNEPSGRSNDFEVAPSEGLRNRKQPEGRRSTGVLSSSASTLPLEGASGTSTGSQEASIASQQLVEHYKGSSANEDGWVARLAAMLVGEDPSQSYALICGNCRMHNGLARKEDFPYITYYCPHCHALNGHQHGDGKGSNSGSISGNSSSAASDGQGPNSRPISRNSSSAASEGIDVSPKASSVDCTEAKESCNPPAIHPSSPPATHEAEKSSAS